ncbi:ROK family transcriptional regulator [Microbacterium sp. NPDC089321]|uniref:ROK family transcriptional regulator n=1 Tax=Microbacterium sp. NPDC089321 TaxID=3155183 RepID=UPI0034365382
MTLEETRSDALRLQRQLPGSSHGRVLQLLVAEPDQSRADLARAAGFTKATVSALVMDMIEDGLVVETRRRAVDRPGRPAVELNFDWSAWRILAMDLSPAEGFTGAVLDLAGGVHHRVAGFGGPVKGDDAVQAAIDLAHELSDTVDVGILGVGVSAPGTVDADGVILESHNLRWSQVPLRDIMLRELQLPVCVENDANLVALAEYALSPEPTDLMAVKLGYGVGGGIVANGQLIHGSRFTAGEIGHIASGDDADAPCVCGRVGCLEATLSLPRLHLRLSGARDAEERAGILDAAGRMLGNALAPVVGALGIEALILTGVNDAIAGPLLAAAREAMRPRLTDDAWSSLDMRVDAMGGDIVLRGALSLVTAGVLGLRVPNDRI